MMLEERAKGLGNREINGHKIFPIFRTGKYCKTWKGKCQRCGSETWKTISDYKRRAGCKFCCMLKEEDFKNGRKFLG